MRHMTILGLVVASMILTAGRAHAQGWFQGTSDNPVGPTVSPYLNLLQTNQFGATNYQSLVKPLVDQHNAINRQGNSLNRLQQQVNTFSSGAGSAPSGQGTGHVTFFMNYSHFYPPPAAR